MLCLKNQALDLLLPWKCASQTVRTRLSQLAKDPYQQLFYYNPTLRRVCNQHHTYADYLLLPESHQGRKVATFVRNPYDRVASGFMQICRDINVIPKLSFQDPELKLFVLDQLAQNSQDVIRSGYNINEWFMRLSPYRILDISSSVFLLHPVTAWTHVGKKQVDFIGKVENFEADFVKLKALFGIGETSMESANQSKLSTSLSPDSPYRYATTLEKRTVAKINALFAEDFVRLGYEKIML